MHPAWSYLLNTDFEDHAEHEYAILVTEHPEWEQEAFESAFAGDYAAQLLKEFDACLPEHPHWK